uniref:Uncharacterized protein n=1 Tax=Tanacetum cinerariifolium TaxID=118510 RepID=A0A699JBJ4_TANCI|nr:hypothetical protein [Tanacetum cinerariifolium]
MPLLANFQATQVIEDTHVIMTTVTPEVQQQSSLVSSGFISIMLNPNPDVGIESILNLNTESTSLVDVLITTNAEISPSSVTTLLPPHIPFIHPLQQTPVFTSTIDPISSIHGIVDTHLANKMNEAIKTAVQLLSDRLRDEAKAKNEDFINKIDENIKKIIKEQVSKILLRIKKFVNKQLEAEVLTRDTVTFKRCRDDEDEDEEPFAGSHRGSMRRRFGKELESTSAPKEKTSKSVGSSKEGSKSKTRSTDMSAQAKEEVHTDKNLEEPTH